MKFENPTMAISKFEVEDIVTTSVQSVGNVNEAVNNFINPTGTATVQGIKLVF